MIRIGKIVATHGINGGLILTHVLDNSKWLKKDHILQVEMQKGSYIPYFISKFKENNNKEYLINIEDIDKVENAKKLVTKHVYVDESILSGYERQSPLLWIDFMVIDSQNGEIGKIDDVVKTGSQWLATLTYKNAEILIPLIDQTINELDIKKKIINMTLPDGLLEIYLGG